MDNRVFLHRLSFAIYIIRIANSLSILQFVINCNIRNTNEQKERTLDEFFKIAEYAKMSFQQLCAYADSLFTTNAAGTKHLDVEAKEFGKKLGLIRIKKEIKINEIASAAGMSEQKARDLEKGKSRVCLYDLYYYSFALKEVDLFSLWVSKTLGSSAYCVPDKHLFLTQTKSSAKMLSVATSEKLREFFLGAKTELRLTYVDIAAKFGGLTPMRDSTVWSILNNKKARMNKETALCLANILNLRELTKALIQSDAIEPSAKQQQTKSRKTK